MGANLLLHFLLFDRLRTAVTVEADIYDAEFRVQKYANKGGYLLSLKFAIIYAFVFDWPYVHVINVKVERNQRRSRRTGRSFQGLFFSFLLSIPTCIRTP